MDRDLLCGAQLSRPVAAAVFLRFAEKALYNTRIRRAISGTEGNDLAWGGIKFLAQEGARTLHLGRTSIENEWA